MSFECHTAVVLRLPLVDFVSHRSTLSPTSRHALLVEELMGTLTRTDARTTTRVIQLVGEPVQHPPVNLSVCVPDT